MLAAGYATVKKKKRKKSQCMASKRGIKSVLVSLWQSRRASCSSDSEACLRCRRPGCNPWVGKVLWRRAWQPGQCSCWEKSMHRGAWRATVRGIRESRTRLSNSHTHTVMETAAGGLPVVGATLEGAGTLILSQKVLLTVPV